MKRGDIVDYTFAHEDGSLVTRPAVVIEVRKDSTADLHVFWGDGDAMPTPPLVTAVVFGVAADPAEPRKEDPGTKQQVRSDALAGVKGTCSERAAVRP